MDCINGIVLQKGIFYETGITCKNECLFSKSGDYVHQMHWNLKGHGFFTLHSKLEEYYDQTADIIDEVAERILAKDALPIANLKEALEISKVKELPDKAINIDEAIRILTIDVEYWVNDSKEIVELADKEGDVVTSDIFTGYVKEYEKTLWMLKAFAQN